jgi:IS5 family transposase
MRPRERRETGEQDLFRSRLDQIIDMNHPLAKLARTVDWKFLEGRLGEVYTDDPGHPRRATTRRRITSSGSSSPARSGA